MMRSSFCNGVWLANYTGTHGEASSEVMSSYQERSLASVGFKTHKNDRRSGAVQVAAKYLPRYTDFAS
jgi:hypothetical protein